MKRSNIGLARKLRRTSTDAEVRLWQALRGGQLRGAKFLRQHPLGPYVVDFICRAGKLVIEVDGGQHGGSARDAARDAWLAAQGYRVVRFWNHDVLGNLEGVLETLLRHLGHEVGHVIASPQGGEVGAQRRVRGTRPLHSASVDVASGDREDPLTPTLSPVGRGSEATSRHGKVTSPHRGEVGAQRRVRGTRPVNAASVDDASGDGEDPVTPTLSPLGRGSKTITSATQLEAAGLIAPAQAAEIASVAAQFQVAITPAMLGLIGTPGRDGADAIAAQFVPDARELQVAPEELADPIGDLAHAPLKGIVHRYPDRVLLKPTHVCAVYCRFCFRREQVGSEGEVLGEGDLQAALDYIRARPQIFEVILSGGDPLILSPRRLREIVEAVGAIAHVKVLRYHTRLPVAAPERIDAELIAAMRARQASYVVLHANHASELSDAALAACARIVDAGMPMLSQSVLLKGVNDDAASLEELFRALIANRIKPYYLHHPDLARGTSHFRGSIDGGRALMKQLRARLSGIAQPAYVLDIPGGHGKVPLTADYLHEGKSGTEIEAPDGTRHPYPPAPPPAKGK